MISLSEAPAERFLNKLRNQIQKVFVFGLCFIIGSFCILSSGGCLKKKNSKLIFGTWRREGTYLNGKFNHERWAMLTLTKTSFKLEEQNCELRGAVSYQPHAMIFLVQQVDCQGVSLREKLYYGFYIDPSDEKLRIFHNNQYNDTILDVYRKVQ